MTIFGNISRSTMEPLQRNIKLDYATSEKEDGATDVTTLTKASLIQLVSESLASGDNNQTWVPNNWFQHIMLLNHQSDYWEIRW